MSITCRFKQVTVEQLEFLKHNPKYMEAFLHVPNEMRMRQMGLPEEYVQEAIKKTQQMMERYSALFKPLLEKRAELMKNPLFANLDNEGDLNIDKSWQGIHFLLTGHPHKGDKPLADVIMGGKEIGKDTGYGPPKYLSPEEVTVIAQALEPITPEELEKRFTENIDGIRNAQLYAVNVDEPDEVEYFTEYYGKVKEYYTDTAAKGMAMIIYFA